MELLVLFQRPETPAGCVLMCVGHARLLDGTLWFDVGATSVMSFGVELSHITQAYEKVNVWTNEVITGADDFSTGMAQPPRLESAWHPISVEDIEQRLAVPPRPRTKEEKAWDETL